MSRILPRLSHFAERSELTPLADRTQNTKFLGVLEINSHLNARYKRNYLGRDTDGSVYLFFWDFQNSVWRRFGFDVLSGEFDISTRNGSGRVVHSGLGPTEIGQTVLARQVDAAPKVFGDLVPGSSLKPSNCKGWTSSTQPVLPGMWRCLGYVGGGYDQDFGSVSTMFLRVS